MILKSKTPFFSIIVPTYNRPDAVRKLIGYVIKQRYTDWELIIVDDSNTNISSHIEKFMDDRIVYSHRGVKSGVSLARNFGAAMAGGRYIIFIDDDDRVSEEWLIDFALLAEENQYPDLLFCGMEIEDVAAGKKEIYIPSDQVNFWRLIIPGSWAALKEYFDKQAGYDERFLFGENTELFFRIRANNPRKAITDTVNFFYYPSLDGGSKNLVNIIESDKLILVKHINFFNENKYVRKLYLGVIGVSLIRLKRVKESQPYLREAFLLFPRDLKALIRYIISLFPFIATRIYRTK